MLPPYIGPSSGRTPIPAELINEAALLKYLDVSTKELKKIWWFRDSMYRQFEIAKSKDKTRRITAPDNRLKYLQRSITPLLGQLYRVRNPVHGFVTQRSIKTNALAHLRKRFIINLDLEDFFPSISENRIKGVLSSIGIDGRVAEIIARLCCFRFHLPQGAPTSPVLSNMICFRLDRELLNFAKKTRCIYTRYADDITFSSHQPMTAFFEGAVPPPGHFPPSLLIQALRVIFSSNGFNINPKKAHYADKYSRRMVTGIKVNELLNVDRRYIRNIRAALYSVETLSYDAAQKKFEKEHKKEHNGKSNLRAHLEGKIIWLRYIRGQSDPVYRAIAVRFNDSFPDRKIKLAPTAEEIRDRSVWVVEHSEDIEKMVQGSAFFLNEVGLVTAAHCVDGQTEVEVYHPSKRSNIFKAKVYICDNDLDLAILYHGIPTTEFFELEGSKNSVEVGDGVTALGYPSFGPGDELSVRAGNVHSNTVKNGVNLIDVSQKLSPGMSGGPVLDKDDKVVGIIHKGGTGEDRDFAIDISMLYNRFAEL